MIRIIDKQTGRDFHLPAGFKISIDKSNPFLSTQGTVSLPVVFPWTAWNSETLEHPTRFDRAGKLKQKREVIIQAGIYQRLATLQITGGKLPTAYGAGYINATFLFDEAQFYNQMKDVTMQTVFGSIIRDDFASLATRELRVAAWVDYMNGIMFGTHTDDFDVFPVCYEIGTDGRNGFLNQLRSKVSYRHNIDDYELAGKVARTFVIDGANVSIPVGYEVTPFLKKSYVLRTLFSSFGYVLNEDYLTKYPDFQREVELNNTADALMPGFINYGQLVPTKTINEFLNGIRYKYGCEFFLADNNVDVKLVFWNDLFESSDLMLDKIITDSPMINQESFKIIKLTCGTTNKIGDPKFKTFNDMVLNYVDKRYKDYRFIQDDNIDIYNWNIEYLNDFTSESLVQNQCNEQEEVYLGSVVFVTSK